MRRREKRERRPARSTLVLLTCVLAVPTVPAIMYGWDLFPAKEALLPYLITGLILGLAHLVLRPVLRLLSAPIGCLTLGLFGLVIDVGLIYLAAGLVKDCPKPEFLCALLTALLINTITALVNRRG